MNAKEQIKTALSEIMPVSVANACHVFKGYDVGTGRTGWHYIPFGSVAQYLGKSLDEALEVIEDKAAELLSN